MGGSGVHPLVESTARTCEGSPSASSSNESLPPARAAPRRATPASRTSARSKKRSAPLSWYGTPASDRACSYTSDWELTR